MKLKNILMELNSKELTDKLYNLSLKFRSLEEDRCDWLNDKTSFKGTCSYVSEDLANYLTKNGYEAKRVRGYYTGASPDFEPNMDDWKQSDIWKFNKNWRDNGESSEGLKFPHWWVEYKNYIIDITEDQFHPGEEDEYRVGIYKKPNLDYKRE